MICCSVYVGIVSKILDALCLRKKIVPLSIYIKYLTGPTFNFSKCISIYATFAGIQYIMVIRINIEQAIKYGNII